MFDTPTGSRRFRPAWAASERSLVVFGGDGGDGNAVEGGNRYDFDSSSWTQLPGEQGPSARWGASLTSVDSEAWFMWGGQQESLDLDQQGWLLRIE